MTGNPENDVDYLTDSDFSFHSSSAETNSRIPLSVLSKLLPSRKRTTSDLETNTGKKLKLSFSPKNFITLPVTSREKKTVADINSMVHLCEPGFINQGNSCYLNAALQCLLHCDSFIQQIKEHGDHLDLEGTTHTQFCVLNELHKLVENYFKNGSEVVLNLNVFIQNMKSICPLFVPKQQQDAEEFIQLLFQAIDQVQCNGCADSLFKEKKYPDEIGLILRNSVIGYMKTTITCDACQYSSTSRSPFTKLSVATGSSETVEEALEQLMKKEVLEGANAYACPTCEVRTKAAVTKEIDETPNLFILQLNRFNSNGKADDFMSYSQEISLLPYSSAEIVAEKYELVSVLTHHGPSMRFGHYTADVKCSDGHWCRTDDIKRSKISSTMALKNKAYILFYKKRGLLWELEELEIAVEMSGNLGIEIDEVGKGRLAMKENNTKTKFMKRVKSMHENSESGGNGNDHTIERLMGKKEDDGIVGGANLQTNPTNPNLSRRKKMKRCCSIS